jgi:hypothetical protein
MIKLLMDLVLGSSVVSTLGIFCVGLGLFPVYGQVTILSVSLWVSEEPCSIWLFICVCGSCGSVSLWQVLVSQRWCQSQCHLCLFILSWIMSCILRLFNMLCDFLVLCAGIVANYNSCNQWVCL